MVLKKESCMIYTKCSHANKKTPSALVQCRSATQVDNKWGPREPVLQNPAPFLVPALSGKQNRQGTPALPVLFSSETLARIVHGHFVSFEKKETKTDGCNVREQVRTSTKYAPGTA
ncbi:MAG: hypothetical protein CSA33_06540 [Desulfobulbus propionicus]|nr:MAG: hypothetical protein CSA33_06540 [Desulfobulbus propionicus]